MALFFHIFEFRPYDIHLPASGSGDEGAASRAITTPLAIAVSQYQIPFDQNP